MQLKKHNCGLDTKLYQSYSYCIGTATDSADHWAFDIQIQTMGRWKSFKKYIRVPLLTLLLITYPAANCKHGFLSDNDKTRPWTNGFLVNSVN